MMLMWVYDGKPAIVPKEKIEEWLTNALPELLKALNVKVYDMDGNKCEMKIKIKELL